MVRIIDVTEGEHAEIPSNKTDEKPKNDNKNGNKNNTTGNSSGNGANDSINCRKKETGINMNGINDELNEMTVDIAHNGQTDDIIGQAAKGLGQQNGDYG